MHRPGDRQRQHISAQFRLALRFAYASTALPATPGNIPDHFCNQKQIANLQEKARMAAVARYIPDFSGYLFVSWLPHCPRQDPDNFQTLSLNARQRVWCAGDHELSGPRHPARTPKVRL